MKLHPKHVAVLVLACALSSAGCKSGEPWTFGLTRSVNESGFAGDAMDAGGENVYVVVAVVAICCVPFALDLAFLPITLTHDRIARPSAPDKEKAQRAAPAACPSDSSLSPSNSGHGPSPGGR